ncbi:MAG TPA: hypothetical protein VF668_21060 [Pyrinomonadaceae bacterium]|jgi:hypothetical protein
MTTKAPAMVEDLYRISERGEAEVVSGEAARVSPAADAARLGREDFTEEDRPL